MARKFWWSVWGQGGFCAELGRLGLSSRICSKIISHYIIQYLCEICRLKQFGYDVTDLTVDELLTKKVLIRQYRVETDIHPNVKGVTFEKIWKNKVKAKFGQTFAWFASLDDLIKMKKAASRPQDLEDLKYLRRLKKRNQKR